MAVPSDRVFVSDLPTDVDQPKLEYIFGGYGNVTNAKLLPGAGKHNAFVTFATNTEAAWVVENLNGNIPQGLTTPIQVKFASSSTKGCPGKGGKDSGYGQGGKDGSFGGGKDAGWGGGKDAGWASNGKGSDRYEPYGKGGKGVKGSSSVNIAQLKQGLQLADALPGGKWSNDSGALWVGGLPSDTTDLDMYHIFAPFGSIPADGVRAMLNEDGSCKGYGFVNYIDPSVAENVINTLNGTQMPDGSVLQVKEKAPSRKGGQAGQDGGKDSAKGGKDFGGKDSGKADKGDKGSKGGFKGCQFGKGGGWW